jgi:hypothetical protein
MPKVTVYKVRKYDILAGETRIEPCVATREGAVIMGGEIVESSAVEIDESQLMPGEQWTPLNFKP